jgi:hypothetical protein
MRPAALLLLLASPRLGARCPGCSCPSPSAMACCGLGPGPPPAPTGHCGANCSVTELTITDSELTDGLTASWLEGLGLCPAGLTSLRVRGSRLDLLPAVGSLPALAQLDLRGNSVLGGLPDPGPSGLTHLWLSGSGWPCILENSTSAPHSKSSLALGRGMAWLLEPRWAAVWRDANNTFCGAAARREGVEEAWYYKESTVAPRVRDPPRTLQQFLRFTQVP